MAERDLLVRIIGDDKSLQRALKRSGTGVATFDSRLSRSTSGILKWGKAAALAGAGAAVGFGVAITKTVGAASRLGEEINKSTVLFGKSSNEILSWSQTTASSIGLSRRAALEGAGAFAAMFSTIGVGDQTSADMSKRLVTLAADMASFSNQDPEDMLLRLRSGLAGEAEPLRRFGILLSEARVKQEAVRLGLVKTGDELTEQQKVQARYSLILRDAGKANGDFARTSDSLANAQRIARAQIEDISASIGGALLPVVARALTAFNHFLPTISKGVAEVSARVGPALSSLVDGIGSRLPELRRIAGSIIDPFRNEVLPVLRDVGGIIATTWSNVVRVFAQNAGSIRKIATNVGQTFRIVWTIARPTIVFLFTKALPTAIRISIAILEKVTGVAKTLAQVFVRVVSVVIGALDKLLGGFAGLAEAASHIPFVGDKFDGVADKVNAARERLRNFRSDLDELNGKQVDVTVNVRTRRKGEKAGTRAKAGADAATDAATDAIGDTTAATENLGDALDDQTRTTKTVETKAERARKAFDRLMDNLGLDARRAEVTRRLSDDLAVLRAMEKAVRDQIAVEGRTAELEGELFDIRQRRSELRQQQRQRSQFLALGLTGEGERKTPSARALLRRVGNLREQLKGTPLDTERTRNQLDRIVRVLRGKYGKAGKDVREAILQMLNDISSALSSAGGDGAGGGGRGELTRGGIRSTENLVRGLGLTQAQEDAIRRRNMRVTRRRGRISAFGFAVGQGTAPAGGLPAGVLRGDAGRAPIIINGPITVVADNPDAFMRELQKKSARTAGSRRGRHGGVRLGLA